MDQGTESVGEKTIPHGRVACGTIAAPPSKSVTQRALLAAAVADGRSIVRRPLLAGDNRRLIAALQDLGIGVTIRDGGIVEVIGCGGRIAAPRATLQVGNAGTTMRFLTALLAFGDGDYVIDGDPRMRRRPIEDLLATLRDLGARAVSVNGDGCPPVRVGAGSPPPAKSPAVPAPVRLRGDRSSQFLSAILLAAPLARRGVDLTIDGPLVSRPYVDLTVAVLRRFGVEVRCDEPGAPTRGDTPGPAARRFRVPPGSACRATDFTVEGDWSSSSYFFAAAAVTGGEVTVTDLESGSEQGDARFVDLLERMGCEVVKRADAVTVRGRPGIADLEPGDPGDGALRGVEADCADMPDIVPTLAVVALFAAGPTRITGVPHLRIKESDRIAALVAEIRRLGGEAAETADGLTILPRPLHGARVETYEDHRMAMAFAIAGLRVPGLTVANPACVAKSFPEFWGRFEAILVPRPGR